MARIKVTADMIETHVDEHLEVELTSFEWNSYGSGEPDIEYNLRIDCDMDFDSDDYVDLSEYMEVVDELKEVTEKLGKVQKEKEELEEMVKQLKNEGLFDRILRGMR